MTFCDPMDCSPPGSSAMGFSKQGYWSGLPCPTPGNLPNPGIKPESLESPAVAGRFFTTLPPGKPGRVSYLALMTVVDMTPVMFTSMKLSSDQNVPFPSNSLEVSQLSGCGPLFAGRLGGNVWKSPTDLSGSATVKSIPISSEIIPYGGRKVLVFRSGSH